MFEFLLSLTTQSWGHLTSLKLTFPTCKEEPWIIQLESICESASKNVSSTTHGVNIQIFISVVFNNGIPRSWRRNPIFLCPYTGSRILHLDFILFYFLEFGYKDKKGEGFFERRFNIDIGLKLRIH